MLTLRKGDAVKYLSPESSLIKKLKGDGWKVDGEVIKENDELEQLRAEAEALGIKPHHKAGPEKIRELIAEAKGK